MVRRLFFDLGEIEQCGRDARAPTPPASREESTDRSLCSAYTMQREQFEIKTPPIVQMTSERGRLGRIVDMSQIRDFVGSDAF
jgi:hypothetical protein